VGKAGSWTRLPCTANLRACAFSAHLTVKIPETLIHCSREWIVFFENKQPHRGTVPEKYRRVILAKTHVFNFLIIETVQIFLNGKNDSVLDNVNQSRADAPEIHEFIKRGFNDANLAIHLHKTCPSLNKTAMLPEPAVPLRGSGTGLSARPEAASPGGDDSTRFVPVSSAISAGLSFSSAINAPSTPESPSSLTSSHITATGGGAIATVSPDW
jgi:hypothetical protein